MSVNPIKRYLFASDFDQTLTFNDSGYVLSELVGISTEEPMLQDTSQSSSIKATRSIAISRAPKSPCKI